MTVPPTASRAAALDAGVHEGREQTPVDLWRQCEGSARWCTRCTRLAAHSLGTRGDARWTHRCPRELLLTWR